MFFVSLCDMKKKTFTMACKEEIAMFLNLILRGEYIVICRIC